MTITFDDEELKSLIETGKSKKYKKIERDKTLYEKLIATYNILRIVANTSELTNYSYLRYEKLKYELTGLSSVRIANNRVERLIFTEHEEGISITLIELDDTHYGNKK